jgi:hypothetical protein
MNLLEGRLYLGALLSGLALVGWWSVDRTVPVQTRLEVAGAAIAGESAVLLTSVNRARLCKSQLSRSLFDGANERTVLPELEFEAPGGLGEDHFRQRVPIPADATAGVGRIRFVLVFRCNPTHLVWPIGPDVIEVPVLILPRAAAR